MPIDIPRRTYTDIYGPTVGDRVRLADTELFIEVEKDHTVYGDGVKVRRRQDFARMAWVRCRALQEKTASSILS